MRIRSHDGQTPAWTRPGNLLHPNTISYPAKNAEVAISHDQRRVTGIRGASGQCKAKVWPLQHLRNSAKKNPVDVTEEVTLAYSLPLREGFVVCKSRVRKVVQMQESCRKFGQLPHNHRYYRHITTNHLTTSNIKQLRADIDLPRTRTTKIRK